MDLLAAGAVRLQPSMAYWLKSVYNTPDRSQAKVRSTTQR